MTSVKRKLEQTVAAVASGEPLSGVRRRVETDRGRAAMATAWCGSPARPEIQGEGRLRPRNHDTSSRQMKPRGLVGPPIREQDRARPSGGMWWPFAGPRLGGGRADDLSHDVSRCPDRHTAAASAISFGANRRTAACRSARSVNDESVGRSHSERCQGSRCRCRCTSDRHRCRDQ